MKILVDEDIPLMTVKALPNAGHEVIDIRGTIEAGMTDDALWRKAQIEKALMVTTDKEFTRR